MSDKPEGFNIFLIALSVLTIIESIILKCVFSDDPASFLMAFFFLSIPFVILWFYAICIAVKNIRMRNVWERCLVAWVAILLLLIPVSFLINKWYKDYNYSSAIIELPDGDTLTITSDKIIFGKCDDPKNPQKDYIDLHYECHNYSITLTQDDSLYIWTENDSLPATTHKLRYPVGKIYTGDVAVGKKIKWMFEYYFMYDGIHTGGSQILKIRKGDSLCVKTWVNYSPVHIGKREYLDCTTLKDDLGDSIPVDSL